MNIPSARPVSVAMMVAGLGCLTSAAAEVGRAEELEQLRINTAYLIEPGEFEIDIIPSYFDYDDTRQHGVEVELEYAVSERLMLEVEIPYHWVSAHGFGEDDGAGNVEVAAKWLVTERGNFAMGFNAGVQFPASNEHLGDVADDLWGVELTAPVSFYFPDRHTRLHIEPGVEWREQQGLEEQLLNIALEHRPSGGNLALQLGSNLVYESGELEAYLVPSFEVAASGVPFQFGMAVAAGLTSESANWGVLFDLEIEF